MNRVKKIISMLLSIIILVVFGKTEVNAAEFEVSETENVMELETEISFIETEPDIGIRPLSDFIFVNASITVSHGIDGMNITIATTVDNKAMLVGVKNVEVWHKNDKGKWDKVAVSSGGEEFDCTGMGSKMTYTGAVWGDTYKITCVHYAQVGSTFRELKHDTGEFVYNFDLYASADFNLV